MRALKHLFANNRACPERMRHADPELVQKRSRQPAPSYLWIGCSDNRVPANQIVGLLPGEVFVHRNLASVVEHTDLNWMAVLQFAVDVLKVKHIIVCGHYGCAGIHARPVKNILYKHARTLESIPDCQQRADRLCELNVIEQVVNVCETTVCRAAWEEARPLTVHGWICGLKDGFLRDLNISVSGLGELPQVYRDAISGKRVCGKRRFLKSSKPIPDSA